MNARSLDLNVDVFSQIHLQIRLKLQTVGGLTQSDSGNKRPEIFDDLLKHSFANFEDIHLVLDRGEYDFKILVPCDRLRLVLRGIIRAFSGQGFVTSKSSVTPLNDLEVIIPTGIRVSRHNIKNAGQLAELVILVEALLPAKVVYEQKLQSYINRYGELTKAAKSNLDLLSKKFGLSSEESKELQDSNLQSLTLQDKYNHFRNILASCNSEEDLSGEYQKIIMYHKKSLRLPKRDFDYLIAERRKQMALD